MNNIEILRNAIKQGYTKAKDNASTWDIENLIDELSPEGNYVYDEGDGIVEINDDGYRSTVPTWTLSE